MANARDARAELATFYEDEAGWAESRAHRIALYRAAAQLFQTLGDTVRAAAVLARLETSLNRKLSIVEFFRYPTIRSLADHLGAADDPQAEGRTRASLDAAKARGKQQRRVKRRDYRRTKR